MKNYARLKIIAALLLPGLFFASFSYAENAQQERVIGQAKQVLTEMMVTPDQSIPEELLAKCKAIAIYPFVLKGGFLIGGRYGKGVVLKRDKKTGEWGPVTFSTIAGVSAGLQAGIQATDLVLILLNNKGLESLLSSKFTLGGDIAISVGPIGRTSEISTDFFLRSMILSYSRSRGLFAGVAFNGAIVAPDNAANSAYYGKAMTSNDILINGSVPIKASSKELVDTLNLYSARWQKRESNKKP